MYTYYLPNRYRVRLANILNLFSAFRRPNIRDLRKEQSNCGVRSGTACCGVGCQDRECFFIDVYLAQGSSLELT